MLRGVLDWARMHRHDVRSNNILQANPSTLLGINFVSRE